MQLDDHNIDKDDSMHYLIVLYLVLDASLPVSYGITDFQTCLFIVLGVLGSSGSASNVKEELGCFFLSLSKVHYFSV